MSTSFQLQNRHIKINHPDNLYRLRKDQLYFSFDTDTEIVSVWWDQELILDVAYNDITAPNSQDITELATTLGSWLDDPQPKVATLVSVTEREILTLDTIYETWFWSAYKTTDTDNDLLALWDDGEDEFSFLASAEYLKVTSASSDDDDDDNDGSGAGQIIIYGLDGNYNEISENLNLNGTSTVTTVNQYLRVNKVIVIDNGQDGVIATGDIDIKNQSNDLVTKINAGDSESLIGLYTVPNNKTLIINNVVIHSYDVDAAYRANYIRLVYRLYNEGLTKYLKTYILDGVVNLSLPTPLKLPPKTDLFFLVQEATSASGAYSINCWGKLIS